MAVTLFPFPASFSRSTYDVTREYRTDIIVSRSGKEQRRALRQTPRKRIEYVSLLAGDCLRDFDRAMITAQRTLLTIPERIRFVAFTDGLPAGFSSLTVDPVPSWCFPGAVLVLASGMRHAIRTVTAVAGTTVTFAETDGTPWEPIVRLMPSLDGYLESSISAPLTSHIHSSAEASIIFNVDPGSGQDVEPIGSATTTLNGREVFLKMPNRWEQVQLNRVQDGAAAVDYGFGRVRRFFPIPFSTRMWEANYTACDFDHADQIRQFFDRMLGRQHEFYMPTWQEDLLPAAGVTSGGTTITIKGTATDAGYDPSTIFKAIGLRKIDGTWIVRTVTGITTSGANSIITIGSSWGETIGLSGIERVSWLPVWRFSSDTMTMSWQRQDIATIKLPMQMIENLAVET